MLQHLNNIHKEYTQTKNESECFPISLTDAQIITELIRIAPKGLANILSVWKCIPDEDVMDQLLNFGPDLDDIEESDDRGKERGKEHKPFPYIEVNGKGMALYYIRSWEPTYEIKDGKEVFGILLNREPMPMPFAFYLNTHMTYSTEEIRDRELENLKNKLIEHGYCKII